MNADKLARLNQSLRAADLPARIALLSELFPKLVFTTAFGTEDQLLTWAIIESGVAMQIETHLDGPLLEQTQSLHEITKERYDIDIPTGAKNGGAIWISGRAQHALNANRDVTLAVWHEDKTMLEINPLADWSFEEVLQAIAEHEVPINPLFNSNGAHSSNQSSSKTSPENRAV